MFTRRKASEVAKIKYQVHLSYTDRHGVVKRKFEVKAANARDAYDKVWADNAELPNARILQVSEPGFCW